jgi:CubicO group peptidase (beta-lactamase class C family)
MMQTIPTPGNARAGYGFGLALNYTGVESKIINHGGSVAGYRAFMEFIPISRVGAIVLRNCDYGVEQIPGAVKNVVAG